ncbi:hypothetical protein D3C85_969510 [compost metagenome]
MLNLSFSKRLSKPISLLIIFSGTKVANGVCVFLLIPPMPSGPPAPPMVLPGFTML